MIKIAAYFALAMAGALLTLQIIGGLEYTQGGSFYTRASMIAAMVTLAALPVFVEAARQIGASKTVIALLVSFVAFLAYSLPATTGRTGEIKETKVSDQAKSVQNLERLTADRAETARLVDEANDWQLTACQGGNGKNCKSATFVLNQRQASLEKLTKQLDAAKPAPVADLGSDLWAWALAPLGFTSEAIRKSSALSFALGLDIVIWSLISFAVQAFSAVPKASNDNAPSVSDSYQTDFPPPGVEIPEVEALEPETNVVGIWAKAYRAKYGRPPSIPELQSAFPDMARTTVWRKAKAA